MFWLLSGTTDLITFALSAGILMDPGMRFAIYASSARALIRTGRLLLFNSLFNSLALTSLILVASVIIRSLFSNDKFNSAVTIYNGAEQGLIPKNPFSII